MWTCQRAADPSLISAQDAPVLDGLPAATLHMQSRCPTPSCVAAHQRTPTRSCADNGCAQAGQRSSVGSWSVRNSVERSVMLWSLCPRLAGHYHQATSAGCRRTSTVVKPTVRRSPAHRSAAPQRGHDQQGSDRRNSTRSAISKSESRSEPTLYWIRKRRETGEPGQAAGAFPSTSDPSEPPAECRSPSRPDATTAETPPGTVEHGGMVVTQIATSSFFPSPGVTLHVLRGLVASQTGVGWLNRTAR